MKLNILVFLSACIILASCNTAYKTLQTPDDVYYSSGMPEGISDETVRKEDPVNRNMRMKSRDRRWRDFDDWSYNPYTYGYNNPYYYNPLYYAYPVFGCYYCGSYWTTSFIKNSTPRMTNLGSYYNTDRQVVNIKTGSSSSLKGSDRFNNSNGNRNIFRGSRSSGSSGADGIRTYTPSSPSSGGGLGSPVTRPVRQ